MGGAVGPPKLVRVVAGVLGPPWLEERDGPPTGGREGDDEESEGPPTGGRVGDDEMEGPPTGGREGDEEMDGPPTGGREGEDTTGGGPCVGSEVDDVIVVDSETGPGPRPAEKEDGLIVSMVSVPVDEVLRVEAPGPIVGGKGDGSGSCQVEGKADTLELLGLV